MSAAGLARPGVPTVPGAAARDRGSGTVLLVGVVAVAGVLLVALGLLVGAERSRATAQTAADLAALAAAGHLADPREPASGATACAVAGAVAVRNDARLVRCAPSEGGVVTVTTARPAPGAGTARATARAGPAAVRDVP